MATQDPRIAQGFLPTLNPLQRQNTNWWQQSAYQLPSDGNQYSQLPNQAYKDNSQSPAQQQIAKLNQPVVPPQVTPWEWGGEGGKAATAVSAFGALGGLYLGNEARKLAASDLDFKRNSFEKQYQSQRSLVNDQLFDRQQRREREGGLNTEQARAAADDYVRTRGVQ